MEAKIELQLDNKIPGQLGRTPMAVDAGGPGRATNQCEATVTLEHNLAIISYLSHIRPIFVEAHGAHQQHLAVFHEAGEGAKDLLAPGRHARPVPEEALGGIMTLEHVTVSAFELAHHAVIEVRGYHQSVLGCLGQLSALGCKGKKEKCVNIAAARQLSFGRAEDQRGGCMVVSWA